MIKIELLEKDKENVLFIIKNINPAIANTIRRLVLEEVPVMAIEEVKIIKNESALYDEIIAHRLGLVPLTTDLKSYFVRQDCKCDNKGCPRCTLYMSLKAKGPCTVYASDIKSKDSKITPVYPEMPITKLLKGQKLELEMIAILGKGKQHSKFSPGLIYYQGYPIIKTTSKSVDEKLANVCPVKIIQIKDKKVKITDEKKCILCNACVDAFPEDSISIKASEDDFIFHLEPWGQLNAKEILSTALDILDEKIDSFIKQVSKIK